MLNIPVNGNNNSIVPLIVALLHTESISTTILNKITLNSLLIYFQEFIKYKILNLAISKYNKDACTLICTKLGLDNENVQNIYSFLLDIFDMDKIQIDNNKFCNVIPLSTREYKYSVTIKKMLYDWLNNKNVLNIPQFICIDIIRHENIYVDIQRKITLGTRNTWTFYSAVCNNNDKYYTLLYKDNEWFIHDIVKDCQLYNVKMDDKLLVDTIKRECIFVIYKLA